MLIFQKSTFTEFPTQKGTQTAQERLRLASQTLPQAKQLFHPYKPGVRCCEGWSKHTLLVKQGILWNVNMNPLRRDYKENRVHTPARLVFWYISLFPFCVRLFTRLFQQKTNQLWTKILTNQYLRKSTFKKPYTANMDFISSTLSDRVLKCPHS